ncbi:MAG: DegT/DnrJ/EryC1/StrS aminotransferase family protein [Chloroflexi bacterium]|nr:DegT/DnrJ/EryC1/StrS aminotransferase family protein [Chloroflexota bacterium]
MPYLAPDPPLTPLDLSGITRRCDDPTGERARFYGSGRAALQAGLGALGLGDGDEVLLPAYLCESVVSPVLGVGARPTFYPVGRRLDVDVRDVEAAIDARTRAVVLIHYLGFPGPVEEVASLCERRGIVLIEDCAHALYSRLGDRPLGSFGALAIFSPWKSLPLPDGGSLVLNRPGLDATAPARRPGAARTARRLAYRALGTVEQAVGWSPRLALLQRPGMRRGLHDRSSGAPVEMAAGSEAAWRLLRAANAERIVARRRRNYARLLDACRSLSWARPIFSSLPPGVCPLGLPLVAEDRDRWRDTLLRRGVNVRTYWEHLPQEVDLERYPDARWLRDRILILPVHQRLPSDGLEWLARLLPSLGEAKETCGVP